MVNYRKGGEIMKNIKKTYSNIKNKNFKINEEESYIVRMLNNAINEFTKDSSTISLEEWREELIKEYNVSI